MPIMFKAERHGKRRTCTVCKHQRPTWNLRSYFRENEGARWRPHANIEVCDRDLGSQVETMRIRTLDET